MDNVNNSVKRYYYVTILAKEFAKIFVNHVQKYAKFLVIILRVLINVEKYVFHVLSLVILIVNIHLVQINVMKFVIETLALKNVKKS